MARRLMLDEFNGIPDPISTPRRDRAWRGILPALPLLAAPERDIDYPGATLRRLAADRYRATIGRLVWTIERARIEVRATGRRLRQQARYLIGYMRGVRTVVFLEFIHSTRQWTDAMDGLHLELNRLADRLTPEFVGQAFGLLQLKAHQLERSTAS